MMVVKSVAKDDELEQISKLGNQLKGESTSENVRKSNHLKGFYIFFSFDLVNSTLYKSKSKETWPGIFSHFYEYAGEQMNKYFNGVKLWKYVGDEVLFFLKVTDKTVLYNLCENTLKVQNELMKSINDNMEDSKGVLFIKSTIWSADVETIKSGNIKELKNEPFIQEKNLVFFHLHQHGMDVDFLGPDIDTGFRISKFSEKNKMVVSAELAFILYKLRAEYEDANNSLRIEDQLKIVSFEDLKGIWNGRKYPVIWYHNEWHLKEEMFEYDERFNSKLVEKIFQSGFQLESISFLQKVFNDTYFNSRITEIIQYLNENSYKDPFDSKVIAKNQAEVHCVSICITTDKKILIAKRQNKHKLNEVWEFGCGQIALNQDFEEVIKEIYINDFNANIIPLKDKEELVPVSTYTYKNKDDVVVPGIIFTSIISEEKGIRNVFRESDKYSESLLVTMEQLAAIKKEHCVPLFHQNAQKAIKTLEEYKLIN